MSWRVNISGDETILDLLAKIFADGSLRIGAEDGYYFLESGRFDALTSIGDVVRTAEQILATLNGVARLAHGARTAIKRTGSLSRNLPEGRKYISSQTLQLDMVWAVQGIIEPTELRDLVRAWVDTAAENAAVEKALRLFGTDALNWVGLYRLFEIIVDDVGSIKDVATLADVTETTLERFKHTANSPSASGDAARHGATRALPPKRPMKLFEAQTLIRTVLHSWLSLRSSLRDL